MNNIEAIFQLSEGKSIVLEYQNPFDELEEMNFENQDPLVEVDCCYEGLIRFVGNNESILLSHDAIRDEMHSLSVLLSKALDNKLLLHSSINEDIGFMDNQYSYLFWTTEPIAVDDFMHEKIETTSVWIGMRYLLWISKEYTTWLYNDVNGSIIFEIAPRYPYVYRNPTKDQGYISYKKWIKTYKPYLIKIISREIAQQWLAQAHKIEQQIASNIERWEKEDRKS